MSRSGSSPHRPRNSTWATSVTAFTAFYDACVLYPAPLRDLLMQLAMTDTFRAKWSEAVHDEWIRALQEKRPDLKPEKLQASAREILLDESDYDDIKATSLTALTQFGDADAVAKDETLKKQITRISEKGGAKVKRSARTFMSKYGH